MYQYGNIKDIKAGDIIQAIITDKVVRKDQLYLIKINKNNNKLGFVKDDGTVSLGLSIDKGYPWCKLVLTKSSREAKIGDTALRIRSGNKHIKRGDKFRVLGNTIKGLSYKYICSVPYIDCVVLLTTNDVELQSPMKCNKSQYQIARDNRNSSFIPSPLPAIGSKFKVVKTNTIFVVGIIVVFVRNNSTTLPEFKSESEEDSGHAFWYTLEPYSKLDSDSTTVDADIANKQLIPEEETMSTPTITVTMTAKELAKYEKTSKEAGSKTQLELATKYRTEWYDEAGTFRNRVQQSAKEATKELQNPNKLGWTFRTYTLTESRTTYIPTVEVCDL